MINRASVFLRRIRHCHGFGIQSPTDFSFVREVVYERAPYHAYAALTKEYATATPWQMKLARLLFRVTNFSQPQIIVLPASMPEVYKAHITAACPRAEIVASGKADDVCCHLRKTVPYGYATTAERNDECIIVPDIYSTGAEAWQRLVSERHTRHLIMFDLYYVGIAFTCERRYSEHHIVNFY